MTNSGHTPVRTRSYSMSGARSAPPGHTTVPVSAIDLNPRKSPRHASLGKHRPLHTAKNFYLSAEAVRKSQLQHAVTNHRDSGNVWCKTDHKSGSIPFSVSPARGSPPVLLELPTVKLCACKHETELPPIERALDDIQVVNTHLGLTVNVASVKVRIAMIVEEHRDRDAEESANLRVQMPCTRPLS